MQYYKTKISKLSGTSFSEIRKQAESIYRPIKSRSKRTPYIRAKYFRNEKVFITLFWSHLFDKNEKDRTRRLKYFNCSLDLIRNTTYNPETRENFKNKEELLHRFYGVLHSGDKFVVQIKENKRSKRKDFISVYPQL